MLRDIKKRVLLGTAVAGLSILGFGAPAKAILVNITTVGSTFSPLSDPGGNLGYVYNSAAGGLANVNMALTALHIDGGFVASNETAILQTDNSSPSSTTANYVALTYTDLAAGVNMDTGSAYNLGVFNFYTNEPSGSAANDLNGLQFTLQITQSVPAPGGSATDVADVTGTVTVSSNHIPGDLAITNIMINFSQPVVEIGSSPTITYALDPVDLTLNGDPAEGEVFAAAIIGVAPLPATASTGLALLGCIGAFSAIRRRVMA